MSVIPTVWEVEIRRIMVWRAAGTKKLSKPCISTNKPGMVACAYGSGYTESTGKRTDLEK
jgi:hypothetical protein